jgi:hypothetical protein
MDVTSAPLVVSQDDVQEVTTASHSPESSNDQFSDCPALRPTTMGCIRVHSDVYSWIAENENNDFYCKPCHEKQVKKTWTTRSKSNFRKHLISSHPGLYVPKDTHQTRLNHHGFTGIKRKSISASNFTAADKSHADEMLTELIVKHAAPFNLVEQKSFVEFCAALRIEYPVPTQNTIRNRILRRWENQRAKVRQHLERELSGRRCGLTTDMWTSAAKHGYMVITLHYIDDQWQMKSVIIAFIRVMYPNSAKRLAEHFITAVESMSRQLLASIWMITADNASTNPALVSIINEHLLPEAIAKEETRRLHVFRSALPK